MEDFSKIRLFRGRKQFSNSIVKEFCPCSVLSTFFFFQRNFIFLSDNTIDIILEELYCKKFFSSNFTRRFKIKCFFLSHVTIAQIDLTFFYKQERLFTKINKKLSTKYIMLLSRKSYAIKNDDNGRCRQA